MTETIDTSASLRFERACKRSITYADEPFWSWSSDESELSSEETFLKESQFRISKLGKSNKVKVNYKTKAMKEEVLLDGEIKEAHKSKYLVQCKTPKHKTEKKYFTEEDISYTNF